MLKQSKWFRVSKKQPCRICKKEEWCTFTENASGCMRVMSEKPMKNGGWLHVDGKEIPKYFPQAKTTPAPTVVDFSFVHRFLFSRTTDKQLKDLGLALGLAPFALKCIGAAWDPDSQAWVFPMHDERKKIIGLRVRAMDGQKWALAGSRAGLFIPSIPTHDQRQIMICEGPTDCAALLSMGFLAIARPSCLGCEEMVNNFLVNEKIKEAVIIADNDEPKTRPDGTFFFPGQQGAEKLQKSLKVKSCILLPPTKDMREFLNFGGSTESVSSLVKDLIWQAPKQ